MVVVALGDPGVPVITCAMLELTMTIATSNGMLLNNVKRTFMGVSFPVSCRIERRTIACKNILSLRAFEWVIPWPDPAECLV
jgi:hypothetical protein